MFAAILATLLTLAAAQPDRFASLREPVLAPLFTGPWISGQDWLQREHPMPGHHRQTADELCAGTADEQTRRQCYLAESSPVDDAHYDEGGIHIALEPIVFSNAGERALDHDVPFAKDRRRLAAARIALFIRIGADSGKAAVDMSKMVLLTPDGSVIHAAIIRYKSPTPCVGSGGFSCPPPPSLAWALPSHDDSARYAVLIDGDPETIQGLVLRLSGAIRTATGPAIPDLRFRRVMEYYSPYLP